MAELLLNQSMDGYADSDSMMEALVKLQKNLNWMLTHLDSQNIRSINTNRTTIESEDGTTTFDGAQLQMRDENGTLRAVLGRETDGTFMFRLYDSHGNPALWLNEEGNIVFSGKISDADMEGSNLRIAPAGSPNYMKLEHSGDEAVLSLYYDNDCVGGIRALGPDGMEIFGGKIFIGSSSGEVALGPGVSGSFMADGSIVTVKRGIITSIIAIPSA